MYSKLTNETFYTMADAFANSRTNNNIPVKSRLTTGYCNLNSDTFLRHLSAYSIDFYEDGVNGYQLRPFYDNSWSSHNSINEAKENQSLPFQMVLGCRLGRFQWMVGKPTCLIEAPSGSLKTALRCFATRAPSSGLHKFIRAEN